MLADKKLTDYMNLFSSDDFDKRCMKFLKYNYQIKQNFD